MICPERSTLLQWLDGELAPSEAEAVAEHVENCGRCRGFVSAQKHIESVWRESWVDPPDSDFTAMRQVLLPATPWWRTPRTWYIAAAVCAAYIGIKIFFVDGAGTPLASIVQQESTVESIPANEQQTEAEYPEEMMASPVEEIEASMEEEEQIDTAPVGQQLLDQPVLPPAFNVVNTEVQAEMEESESPDGSMGTAQSSTVSDQEQLHDESDSFFVAGIPEEFDRLYRSSASGETVAAGVEGIVTAGVGSGGGGIAGGTAGFAQTTVSDSSDEAFADDVVSTAAAEAGFGSPTCTVTATLESGEAIGLGRDDWPSLFELIDTIRVKSSSFLSEPFVIRVGSDGAVSGAIVPEGTVIDVPEARYGNCEVTVLFY
ncbi:MAG: zf-HC2 domain-containing protein [Candidatus Fermentibacteraceae bacterium]|nr:zf-HC2 domain-containing protein [Candidatus Fermentibacteraceae bacterium]